jgi:hypothetical protein
VVKRVAALAVFDFVALTLLYFVLKDLAWRNSYAESEGLTLHTTYSLFTRASRITGTSIPLVSPPALDWAQVIVVLLIVVNGLYLFSVLRANARRTSAGAISDGTNPVT